MSESDARESGEKFAYYTIGIVFAALALLLRNEMRHSASPLDTALLGLESVGILLLFLSGLAGLLWLRCHVERTLMDSNDYLDEEKTTKTNRQSLARRWHYRLFAVAFGFVGLARWLNGVLPESADPWAWWCFWGSIVAVVLVAALWDLWSVASWRGHLRRQADKNKRWAKLALHVLGRWDAISRREPES